MAFQCSNMTKHFSSQTITKPLSLPILISIQVNKHLVFHSKANFPVSPTIQVRSHMHVHIKKQLPGPDTCVFRVNQSLPLENFHVIFEYLANMRPQMVNVDLLTLLSLALRFFFYFLMHESNLRWQVCLDWFYCFYRSANNVTVVLIWRCYGVSLMSFKEW